MKSSLANILKDTLRTPPFAFPILLLVAAMTTNLLMNIKHRSYYEQIDACNSSLTRTEQLVGFSKYNNCPKYRDALVEKWGLPFTEKTRYSTEDYGIVLLKCATRTPTDRQTAANICPSWLSISSGATGKPGPVILFWWNMWAVFAILWIIRFVIIRN